MAFYTRLCWRIKYLNDRMGGITRVSLCGTWVTPAGCRCQYGIQQVRGFPCYSFPGFVIGGNGNFFFWWDRIGHQGVELRLKYGASSVPHGWAGFLQPFKSWHGHTSCSGLGGHAMTYSYQPGLSSSPGSLGGSHTAPGAISLLGSSKPMTKQIAALNVLKIFLSNLLWKNYEAG